MILKLRTLMSIGPDELVSIFKYLDYSHMCTICCVCSEWNQIASSNSLWQYYFQLLNMNHPSKVPNEILEKDDRFWKHLIRNYFSVEFVSFGSSACHDRTQCFVSSKCFDQEHDRSIMNSNLEIQQEQEEQDPKSFSFLMKQDRLTCSRIPLFDFDLNGFRVPFVKHLIRFVLGRIKVVRVWNRFSPTPGSDLILVDSEKDLLATTYFYDEYHSTDLKVKMKISGLEEALIGRTRLIPNDFMKKLYSSWRYRKLDGFYLYFATESHDRMNEKRIDDTTKHIVLNVDTTNSSSSNSNSELIQNAFLYTYSQKKVTCNVEDEHTMDPFTSEVLSKLIPNMPHLNLSPKTFLPIWCMIFTKIVTGLCRLPYKNVKELTHYYPCWKEASLLYEYKRHYYFKKLQHKMEEIRNLILSNKNSNENKFSKMLTRKPNGYSIIEAHKVTLYWELTKERIEHVIAQDKHNLFPDLKTKWNHATSWRFSNAQDQNELLNQAVNDLKQVLNQTYNVENYLDLYMEFKYNKYLRECNI
ncbi:hypothetical protein C9374_010963 [Naegleria lovaniensis]|uniref:F-box domain-containing protein n=1 Tax=Naegleria lovaniensis TaxID=51637 RepID=A0AA88GFS8_NAELO|nr:uncharacterized protein C9374_010963 [Naegleria lovaniensis]KAG2374393.1 hypothetical protein C9374_010963 [Naegleria lovaniensis]